MSDSSPPILDATDPTSFADLGNGIVSGAGNWYNVNEETLREYAGDVVEHVPLGQLFAWADVWLESPRTVAIWSLPILLWTLPAAWAVAATVALYVTWSVLSPSFPNLWLVRAFSWLQNVVGQGLYYVFVLSILAPQVSFWTTGAGLVGFVVLRWGLARLALGPLAQLLRHPLYDLPLNDQVLRGFILRVALKHRVSLPQLDTMAHDILDRWGSRARTDD
jgi:hypothetical protein